MNDEIEHFVPCGAVAGVMVRTDTARGVWIAPAGLEANFVGVPELSDPPTDLENRELPPRRELSAQFSWAGQGDLGFTHLQGALFGSPRNGSTFPSDAVLFSLTRACTKDPMGRVRTQRRTLMVANPAQGGCLYGPPFPSRRLPGTNAPRDSFLVKCGMSSATEPPRVLRRLSDALGRSERRGTLHILDESEGTGMFGKKSAPSPTCFGCGKGLVLSGWVNPGFVEFRRRAG